MILVLNNKPCTARNRIRARVGRKSKGEDGYCSQKEQWRWRRFKEAGLAAAERLRLLCIHKTIMAEPGRRWQGRALRTVCVDEARKKRSWTEARLPKALW